jgi:hypothetical protein
LGGEIEESRMRFFIDTKKPRIINTAPDYGEYSNGEFSVNYDEENVKNVELYYGLRNSIDKIAIGDCSSGKNKSCSSMVDLSEFDVEKIYYWFVIEDVAGNIVNSSKKRVLIDNSLPVIDNLDYLVENNYVIFNIEVSEKNFDRIVYYDNDEEARVLCSSLNRGFCHRKLKLDSGNHLLKIEVLDDSGNSASKEIEVKI